MGKVTCGLVSHGSFSVEKIVVYGDQLCPSHTDVSNGCLIDSHRVNTRWRRSVLWTRLMQCFHFREVNRL